MHSKTQRAFINKTNSTKDVTLFINEIYDVLPPFFQIKDFFKKIYRVS